jgi:hypothetical protein
MAQHMREHINFFLVRQSPVRLGADCGRFTAREPLPVRVIKIGFASSSRASSQSSSTFPGFSRAAPPSHPAGSSIARDAYPAQQWECCAAPALALVRSGGCCRPALGTRAHPRRGVFASRWRWRTPEGALPRLQKRAFGILIRSMTRSSPTSRH